MAFGPINKPPARPAEQQNPPRRQNWRKHYQKTSKTNATQPSARIARRTASGPRLRRFRIQGRVIQNGRPPNQAERRLTSDAPTKNKSFLKPTNGQPNTSSLPHFKGCKQHPISKGARSNKTSEGTAPGRRNKNSRRFGGGVLRSQNDPPHLHQQRSSKGAHGVYERRPAGAQRTSCNFYFLHNKTNKRDAAIAIASRSRKGVLVYIPINPRIVESRYSTRERVGDSNDDEHATQQRPRIWPSPK